MGEILFFSGGSAQAGLYQLDRGRLEGYLDEVREQIAQWDREEPEDMGSEAYEAWGDRREELEDLMDEILDRLDQLPG